MLCTPATACARTGKDDARRRFAGAHDGGRLTLEARLDSVWEGLHAGGAADCPVCGGRMVVTAPAAAACGACGSQLS